MAKQDEYKFAQSIKKLTADEIGVELKNLRDKLYTLRSQSVTEKVDDHSQFGIAKRSIARLLTEQSARRIKDSGKARTPAATPVQKAGKAVKQPVAKVVHSLARSVTTKATKVVNNIPRRKLAKANKAARIAGAAAAGKAKPAR